jgi:hypothetical protein
MADLMRMARALGLPCLHLEYYCGNKFFVQCPDCGRKILAECHKSNNADAAGLPDILGIAWGLETKRDRNGRGDPFEPAPGQAAAFDRLRAAGLPVLVASPGSEPEAIQFLSRMARIKDNAKI